MAGSPCSTWSLRSSSHSSDTPLFFCRCLYPCCGNASPSQGQRIPRESFRHLLRIKLSRRTQAGGLKEAVTTVGQTFMARSRHLTRGSILTEPPLRPSFPGLPDTVQSFAAGFPSFHRLASEEQKAPHGFSVRGELEEGSRAKPIREESSRGIPSPHLSRHQGRIVTFCRTNAWTFMHP